METLGIDIGGTKIAGGICDEEGNIRCLQRVPTPEDAADINAIVADIYRRCKDEGDIKSIGISAAGNIASDRRTVSFAANLPAWNQYPLADAIEDLIGDGVKVVVENDANAAGWGEYRFGAGRDSRDMIMITVGTGVGGAIIVNGQLVRGAFGMAGEIGHVIMVPDGEACGCGLFGCAEQYASGSALERFAWSAARRQPNQSKHLLEACDYDRSKLIGPMVRDAAQEGDPTATEAFDRLGDWLGRLMADLSAVLDPDTFVIGGGVAEVGDMLLGPAATAFNRYLQASMYRQHASILPAKAGGEAGIIGAADLARID
ncbi:NagC family transcriptional regulator [Bifidobacterium sp. DSM 109958]|uniref:Glucokinase n=1 Tax=Bifidobacterium moraviense TaxID=2675323 RepID=A0A7Y0EZW3_9BIFI|nr:ROK family glucokinase [Bifidobacterium sp. DSM 109958]NMM99432.1 NagC family transcriptional regulator [Bifidobacterium sp. DSM 109958]